jgi:hypothetical protein
MNNTRKRKLVSPFAEDTRRAGEWIVNYFSNDKHLLVDNTPLQFKVTENKQNFIECRFFWNEETFCRLQILYKLVRNNYKLIGHIPFLKTTLNQRTGSFLFHLSILLASLVGVEEINIENCTNDPLRASYGIYKAFCVNKRGYPRSNFTNNHHKIKEWYNEHKNNKSILNKNEENNNYNYTGLNNNEIFRREKEKTIRHYMKKFKGLSLTNRYKKSNLLTVNGNMRLPMGNIIVYLRDEIPRIVQKGVNEKNSIWKPNAVDIIERFFYDLCQTYTAACLPSSKTQHTRKIVKAPRT